MSPVVSAKAGPAPARGPERERQQSGLRANSDGRGWQAPGAAAAGLRIGRPNDEHEVAADRMAQRALASGIAVPPAPTAALARIPQVVSGAGGLAGAIAAAGPEAQDLPAAQRDDFAPRFGHRLDGVRIHAGPSAAAAASAARAQAFTLGRDIYFGEGQYRPNSSAGRNLLAHELAHTLQDRPNVVARKALDTTFDLPENDPGASVEQGHEGHDPAVNALATVLQGGPSQGNGAARAQLGQLPPDRRSNALAALRTSLPASDRGKVGALDDATRNDPRQPAAVPNAMPEVRAGDTAPAAVSAKASPAEAPAVPGHERAAGTAASKMQQAVRSVGAEAPLGGAAAPLPEGLDTAGVPGGGAGAGSAPASAATIAAQGVTAMLSAQMADLQGVAGRPVQFRQDPGGPPGDLETINRTATSQSMAGRFVSGAAEKTQAVLAVALAVPAQAMTALGGARQAIAAQAASQGAVLKQGADAARKQIGEQASRVRGAIAGRHGKTDSNVSRDVADARKRATKAHDDAAGGLSKRAETEKTRIALSYDAALEPMTAVGFEAGGHAQAAAARRAADLRSQYDHESSVLDGPIHDDRLDANADASVKVGDEYAKSFQDTASKQADKLPESRPEILGKVNDITTQARTGFTTQLTHILEGAGALETGSKARSRQAATQMRAALDANATQSRQAVDAAEAQQGGALQEQADAAQGAVDTMVASTLSSFGGGVAQAAQQLSGSIGSFIDQAAETPVPESDELANALTEADPSTALSGMAAQVAAVVPGLTGMLTAAQATGGAALAAAATSAAEAFAGSGAAFVKSAGGINQQSATGFHQLDAGNARSVTNLATDTEAGFQEAVTNANTAYAQFGDQVEANFTTGRKQLLAGLWSKESQADLGKAMEKYGQEAADHVKPRWKRVLKWVVMIVVIVAVIAVTVLSAGALGPVGVILLGAALGAAAGAVQTIADNLIDGEPWSKGVVKAMIVGAVGGAVGGAGGVLLKGVGSVALRIGLEAGVNIVGGVAGEAIGSLATGQAIDWTGALMGALVGAGIGAGLGIAGAMRGKIRVGSIAEPSAAPPPRPMIEPPPAAPSGRIRTALEGAKILAPRPVPAVPEVNVGGAGSVGGEVAPAPPRVVTAEPAPSPAAPEAAAPAPRRAIGFGREGEMIQPTPEPAAGQPRRAIGLGREGEFIQPTAEPVVGQPRRAIGLGREGELIQPTAEPAAGQPRRAIGLGREGELIQPTAEPAAGQPRRAIGFGREGELIPPTPEPAAGQPRRAIGFGRQNEFIAPKPEPVSGAPSAAPAEAAALPQGQPRAVAREPTGSIAGRTGGAEPIRAGGHSTFEPQATARPGGGGKPVGGKPTIAEPMQAKPFEPAPAAAAEKPAAAPAAKPAAPVAETTPPQAEPAAQPKAEQSSGAAKTAPTAPKETASPTAEPQPAKAKAEPVETPQQAAGKRPAEPFDMKQIGADTEPPQILNAADFSDVKLKPGQDALYILGESDGPILKAGKTSASGAKNRFSVYKRAAKLTGKEVQLEVHPLNASDNIAEYFEKALRTNLEGQGHALPWDNTGRRLGPGFGTPGEGVRTPPITKGEMTELLAAHKGNLREAGKEIGVHAQTVRLWAKALGLSPIEFK